MESHKIEIIRSTEAPEIKDPAVIKLSKFKGYGFTSAGTVHGEQWQMSRFTVDLETDTWSDEKTVVLHGLCGPEVCAPAVRYYAEITDAPFRMYVQEKCFDNGGTIRHARSMDGIDFYVDEKPVVTIDMFPPEHGINGVYDVSVTDIKFHSIDYECMTMTGIRSPGCGDIYLMSREKCQGADAEWSKPQRIITEQEIACHNQYDVHFHEWCAEGCELDDVTIETGDHQGEKLVIATLVCFRHDKHEFGERQRVAMLAARNPIGPYALIGMPFEPADYGCPNGENGHPCIVSEDDEMKVIFQARDRAFEPWHLREAVINKSDLCQLAEAAIEKLEQQQRPVLEQQRLMVA